MAVYTKNDARLRKVKSGAAIWIVQYSTLGPLSLHAGIRRTARETGSHANVHNGMLLLSSTIETLGSVSALKISVEDTSG